MWEPLGLEIGTVYKFTLGWGSSKHLQSEVIGKVVSIHTKPYSESFCVVNEEGLIYLWNVPKTRLDMNRIIHKAEKYEN